MPGLQVEKLGLITANGNGLDDGDGAWSGRSAVQPGSRVLDVGSVKVGPAEIVKRGLPDHASIVATHPLFGPQSARDRIAGLKIAVCPIRGRHGFRLAAFRRRRLHLDVIMTTPEDHDREAAAVQGLTHLIAKVLAMMEPLPTRMTTGSFDLLLEAASMVRHDAPEVFDAIERANPMLGHPQALSGDRVRSRRRAFRRRRRPSPV